MYSLNAFKFLWEVDGSQGNTLHVGKILSVGDQQTGRVLDCTARSGMFESLPGLRLTYSSIITFYSLSIRTLWLFLGIDLAGSSFYLWFLV